MKVFVIIPAYNEHYRLPAVLEKTRRLYPRLPLVVVDDGSEHPIKKLTIPGIIWLRHQVNLGKGASLKTGAEYSFSHGADGVIFMDSDGQHDSVEIKKFIDYLNRGYDLVFGSRRPSLDTPLVRLLGKKLSSVYINLLFGVYISDILSGFRALSRSAYGYVKWDSSRYGVESEMVARLGKYRKLLKYVEFPVETIYIDKYKGVTVVDALKIFSHSLWWKLS